MENSLLVTLSRQLTLQRKMDVIANNLANMNTAGFKSDELKFEEYLMPVAEVTDFQGADKRVAFVSDPRIIRDYSEGAIRQTGNDLDVALSGPGWLVVNTPQGERFTRNGQLKLSAEGILVTSDGYPVLGEGGEIAFGANETDITIGKDGTIATAQGPRDRLRVVEFENREAMRKQGNSLYNTSQAPQPGDNTKVIQGSFETSNVQSIKELSLMVETTRAYASVSRILEATDETRGKAIQQLGRLES